MNPDGFVLVGRPQGGLEIPAAGELKRNLSIRNVVLEYGGLRLSRLRYADGGEAVAVSAMSAQKVDTLMSPANRAGAASRYSFRDEESVLAECDRERRRRADAQERCRRRQEDLEGRRVQKLEAEERRRREDEEKRSREEQLAAQRARKEQEERLKGLTADQRGTLQRLLSITGQRDEENSLLLLQANGYDLESSVASFYDANSDLAAAVARSSERPRPQPAAAGGGGGGYLNANQAAAGQVGEAGEQPVVRQPQPHATIEIRLTNHAAKSVSLPYSDSLWSVLLFVNANDPAAQQRQLKLRQTYPVAREFTEADLDLTIQQAGLVPKATLQAFF